MSSSVALKTKICWIALLALQSKLACERLTQSRSFVAGDENTGQRNRANAKMPPHDQHSMMIQTDQELKAAQERIAYFEGLVAQFRVTTSPQEFKLIARAFLDEIEKMHAEVMEYMGRPGTDRTPAEAA